MAHARETARAVTVVTTAGLSNTDDRRLRQRRYAITQLVRIVCFLLAVSLPVPLWAKLVLILGAFILPWLGVVSANGGPTRPKSGEKNALVQTPVEGPERLAVDPGRTIDQEPVDDQGASA